MPLKYRYLIVAVLVIILGGTAFAFYYVNKGSLEIAEPQPGQEDWIRGKGRINFLLLGSDDELSTNSRTDTIILASLDTENKKISLLSIPRDTRVNIPGFGENRINSANALGGIPLVKETISALIKVPIDYYILTNFEGFKGIIDTLGGVEIDVEQNMKYRVYDGMIDLKKGLQRLDGEKALQYVRFRHDKLGDITRTQRQQKFLTALAKEMMQAKNIIKLPVLIPELNKAVKTDLNISQMIALAKDFGNYDVSSITVQTLPGNFVNVNGGSYWYVDSEKAHQVVLEVFAGNTGDVIDTDVKVNTGSNPPKKPVEDTTPTDKKPEEPKETKPVIPEEDIPVINDGTNNPLPPEDPGNSVPEEPKDPGEDVDQTPVPEDPGNSVPEEPEGSGEDGEEPPVPDENQNQDPVTPPEENQNTQTNPDQQENSQEAPESPEDNLQEQEF